MIDQPNQISDYADKLWKGYVLDARELTGGRGVDPLAADQRKNIYAQIAAAWAQLKEDLTSGKFGTEGGSIRFSWQLAVTVTAIGIGIVYCGN